MAEIPKFPDFRPVCLSDRDLLEKRFALMQPEVSELNFTNLFMFRHVHDYNLSELYGNIIILARSYEGAAYFMPPVGDEKIPETIDALMDYMRSIGAPPVINLAWEGFVKGHVAGNSKYGFAPDPNSADYVYKTSDMIGFTGRKFHDKKNLLNRFLNKGYGQEYRRLTGEYVPGAKDLVERWCSEKCSEEIPSTFGETEAALLALDNIESLSTIGGVVLINGRVEAMSLGEELNRDMAVVHVEKANAEYAGLYQYIQSSFLAHEFPHHPFVNREQDLGEPNLRKSKLSYNPIRMVEKYKIWPK